MTHTGIPAQSPNVRPCCQCADCVYTLRAISCTIGNGHLMQKPRLTDGVGAGRSFVMEFRSAFNRTPLLIGGQHMFSYDSCMNFSDGVL